MRNPDRARVYFVGTRRFTSSSQFWTTTTCATGMSACSRAWTMMNRRPSAVTSYDRDEALIVNRPRKSFVGDPMESPCFVATVAVIIVASPSASGTR